MEDLQLQAVKHEHRLEELDRANRRLSLVLYNLTESEEHDIGSEHDEIADELERVIHFQDSEDRDSVLLPCNFQRIGKYSRDQQRPRQARVTFSTMRAKHVFLRLAKELRQNKVRTDDDLTRIQQKERRELSADFQGLKMKGYQPYFRGSEFYFNGSMHTCRLGKAGTIAALP